MNKKLVTLIILSSIIIGGFSGWVFIRFIIPRLNTVPFLVKYNLAPRTAPLTIYRTEQVRVNEGSDSVAAVQAVKPWVVGILSDSDLAHQQLHGAGIVLTSDGIIATTKKSIAGLSTAYVKMYDGSIFPAALQAQDGRSNLVFLKITASNLPTAALGFPGDLQLGQRMIVVQPSLDEFQVSATLTSLSQDARSISAQQLYDGTQEPEMLAIDRSADFLDGSAVASLDQNVQGLIDQSQIVSAESIKADLNQLLNGGTVSGNTVAIHYQYIPASLAHFYNIQQGIIIRKPDPKTPAVTVGSSAAQVGLLEGDIIYKVGNTTIDANNSFEQLIDHASLGSTVQISVISGKQDKVLQLKLDPSK